MLRRVTFLILLVFSQRLPLAFPKMESNGAPVIARSKRRSPPKGRKALSWSTSEHIHKDPRGPPTLDPGSLPCPNGRCASSQGLCACCVRSWEPPSPDVRTASPSTPSGQVQRSASQWRPGRLSELSFRLPQPQLLCSTSRTEHLCIFLIYRESFPH